MTQENGRVQRVFAVSDVHVDYTANWEFFEDFDYSVFTNSDVLLVAGDVATNVEHIAKFLRLMRKHFTCVFDCWFLLL